MAKPARVYTQGNAVPSAAEQQRQIAEQTAAFLAGGGRIQQIPRGVSGQPRLGGPPVPGGAVAD
ncbi:MAG: hypothetical protein CALGDGBN_03344 [Pseudomonadales bacterium]|nr:hypothetical protein [Pseudomonadales bacterium]